MKPLPFFRYRTGSGTGGDGIVMNLSDRNSEFRFVQCWFSLAFCSASLVGKDSFFALLRS